MGNTEANDTIINQSQQNKKAGKKIIAFIIGLLVIGGAYSAYWNLYASKYEETENAYVSGIQNTVTSQVAGNIVDIKIQDSELIKKGTIAIKIDDTDYQLNLDKAANDLARTVRNFKSLEIGKIQNIETLHLKQTDLTKAQNDFLKDKKAYEAGILSKEQLDNTSHILDQAKINFTSANLNLKNSTIQVVAKSISEHPDVAKAINQYKSAYIDLQRTKIMSPVDGIVAKKAVYIGQRVSSNQQLFTVIDVNNEWVDANFKESQLQNIKIGQSVEMHSDVNGKVYQGIISGIGGGSGSALSLLPAQNATGNWIKVVQRVPVRIDINKESLTKNGYLPIGTSMRVNVHLDSTLTVIEPVTQTNSIIYNQEELNKEIQKIIKNNIG